MDLSVVIPVYNEANNIGPLTRRVREVIGPHNQLIVVDDGSTDSTADEIDQEICEKILQPANLGKGEAIRRGVKAARGDVVLFMDGDGQDDPSEIPTLTRRIAEGADFVIGSRFLRDESSADGNTRLHGQAVTPVNHAGNKLLTRLLNLLFGVRVTDSQASLKCFRRDKLNQLTLTSQRYEIETELLIRAARSKLRIAEVPVHRYERTHGHSKLFEVPLGRLIFALRVLKTMANGFFRWR